MSEIDARNDSLVGVRGDVIVIMRPRTAMSKDEALRLAAWLITAAADDERFKEILQKVRNT